MSIRKRLLLSNVAMVIVPAAAIIIIEGVLGLLLFSLLGREPDATEVRTFMTVRLFLFLLVLVITNSLLTYLVSRSIIHPVEKLRQSARRISEGDLDFRLDAAGKDEIGELARAFEEMRKKLKEADELRTKYEESRRELLASISHDLKTPVTSIKGYVEGIQDGVANTPEKRNKYLQTIYTKAYDMERLIDELFLYSKLDLKQVPFTFERLDLYIYMRSFLKEWEMDFKQEDITVSVQAEEGENYEALVDRKQLKRAITNIISNSIKHMNKQDKHLSICLSADPQWVTVEIRDNGRGIAGEALPYVFDHFYREDEARSSATGGSGLGLAIVKCIIEEHGGQVWAESEQGIGTSLFFTLKRK